MSESATLFRLAAELDDHAAAIRARAQRLALATGQLRWHSLAADIFRARAEGSALALLRAAAGVGRAAEALRSHARTVRRLEELAELAVKAGEAVVDGVASAGRTVVEWVL